MLCVRVLTGYRLAPEEIERLLDQLDIGGTGMVAKSQLAASQVGLARLLVACLLEAAGVRPLLGRCADS